jgi:hypothetical protein
MRHQLVLTVMVALLAAPSWSPPASRGAEPSPSTASTCQLRGPGTCRTSAKTSVIALANQVADTSDVGTGRFALSLSDGTTVRGRAGCWWTEDRSEVRYVNAAPFRIDRRRADAGIGWQPSGYRFTFDVPGPGWYEATTDDTLELTTPLDGEGTATFSEVPGQDGAPGTVSGTYRWRCDDPPKRDPGTTVGAATWTLAGPVPGTFTARALCRWERRPGGMAVGSVEAYEWPQPAGDGLWIRLLLGLSPDAPEPSIDVHVNLIDDTFEGSDWTDRSTALVTARSAHDASGIARVLALRAGDTDEEAEKLLAPDQFTGTVRWACGEPPRRTDARYPWHRSRSTPGSIALTFRDAPIREIAVAAACGQATMSDLGISGLRTQLWALGWNRYVLLVLGPDGEPLGEYVAEPENSELMGSQESEDGTWRRTVAMDFVPGAGLTPPPLFPGMEGGFRAAVTTDCPKVSR